MGVELPIRNDVKFRLHFRENSGPKNFIFARHSSPLNPAQSIESELALPQISLTDTSNFTTEPINTFADTVTNNSLTIVGSAVGGVLGAVLLTTVAILILALVLLVRKYRRDLKRKETGIATVRTLNIDMNAHLSYIPVFHQISTGNNVAYVRANDGYTTIVELTEYSTRAHGNGETRNDSEEGNDAIYESIV